MTIYREPPRNNSKRSIGNLDGSSYGMGGTDSVRVQAGTGDFLQPVPVIKDTSYVGGKTNVAELKIQNVGRGSNVFVRREADALTYSFRRIQGGDGVSVIETSDSILITGTSANDTFIKLKDVPSSFVGHNGKTVVVDEPNSRLVFRDIPQQGARITFAESPPAEPQQGDGWWNTTDGSFYLFYKNADTGQWVESGSN